MQDVLMDAPVPTGLAGTLEASTPPLSPFLKPLLPKQPPPSEVLASAAPARRPCAVDATMLRPALKPQIDVDATKEAIRAALAPFGGLEAAPKGWAPDLSHVVLKPGSASYSLVLTLNTAAYDLRGEAIASEDRAARLPSWFAQRLAAAGVPLVHEEDRATRLWGLYAPALQALAASLKNTVALLLDHENLDGVEIRASVAPSEPQEPQERRVPRLAGGSGDDWVWDGDGSPEVAAAKQHAASAEAAAASPYAAQPPTTGGDEHAWGGGALMMTFSIDAHTSHMLRDRFAECERMQALPYGLEDVLWGPTLAELFWLGGAAMQEDDGRRDGVRADLEALEAAKAPLEILNRDLALPYAPPHYATSSWVSADGKNQPYVVWRMAATPEDEAADGNR